MGGFQAVASGLGETGEALGQGQNQALNEALKVRAQLFGEQQQTGELALRQAMLKQNYDIAQQQHELTRQSILQQGWRDMGVTLDPTTQQYTRTFYNEQTGEKRPIPVNGVPPDSPTGLLSYYKNLRGMTDDNNKPVFSDLQAKQIAFKMPQLYREGPVGMMEGFKDHAAELAESGVNKIKSSTGKLLDISTPEGQQAFAQDQLDLIYGRSGFFRYGAGIFGNGGKPIDMTGWTANEQREYKATEAQQRMLEGAFLKMAEMQYGQPTAMDPNVQQQINQSLINNLSGISGSLADKESEINARHGRGTTVAGGAWQPDAKWPSAQGQPDGAKLTDKSTKKVLAIARGSAWTNPNSQ